jgi:hypothetical protein
MVIPLWGKILALSLAKKVTVLVIAKLYGIPRLYRYILNSDNIILVRLLLALC